MTSVIQNYELAFLEFIQNYIHNPINDKFFSLFTFLGDKGVIWIFISLLLITNKKYRKVGIMTFLALILATILGEGLMKNLFQRPRPFIDYPMYELIISRPSGYSFPSGHTTSSFAAAGVLSKNFKKYQSIFWILAFLISISRLYLLVHYPSDVIVGIFLGLFCSLIVLRIFSFNSLLK